MRASVTRYWTAATLSSLVLAAHVIIGLAGPFADTWASWAAALVFAFLLFAMFLRRPKLLTAGRWLCYAALILCGVAVILGIIGLMTYSADLATGLIIGLAYAYVFGLNLAGIQEAARLPPHQVQGDRTGHA
ncbi:MAG: hypothetical protein ACOC95_04780 [Planctomycetota bacterium]